MKKALFLILLLPFIGLSQNATVSPSELLVRYEGTRIGWSAPTGVPMYYYNNTSGTMTTPSAFSADYLTGQGINFNSFDQYTGFSGSEWPSANQTNYGKYYQIKVTAAAGKKIEVKNFKFRYTNYATAFKIVYQKSTGSAQPSDDSFSSNGSVLVTNTTAQNSYNQDLAYAFPSGYFVQPGETLYIRIYGYSVPNNNNKWFLVHGNQNSNETANSSSTGPAIYGVVSSANGVTAGGDVASVTETQSVNINVLANDSATNTTFGAVTVSTIPSTSGSAIVQPDKSITFTAPALTTTTAQVINFTYTLTGADNSTATGSVAVTVNPFASPTVTNLSKTTGVGVAVTTNVLEAATAGSGTISASGVSIVGSATNGTATVNATTGIITYTPNSGTAGQTGTITYKITNSNNKSTTGTITVTIQAVVAPTATADSYTIAKNTATELSVYANDAIGSGSLSSLTVNQPAHGSAVVTNTNKVTYTPETGYTGSDSFTYTVKNSYNATATATVTLTVVNQPTTGALCGTYTVGTGGNYATITAAINALTTNGITCNVTFSLINDATQKVYNVANGESFPLTVTSFNNPNGYTVTFKPAAGKNVKIEAPRPVSSSSGDGASWAVPAVFKFYGASNITIDGSNTVNGSTRNLQIVNSSYAGSITHTLDSNGANNSNDYTDRAVVWIAPNGAEQSNITVKYTVLKQSYKNSGDNYCMGIFAGSGNTFESNEVSHDQANALMKNISIINNDFVNVKEAIYINGNYSNAAQNVKIYDNDLGSETNLESVIQPIGLNNVNGFDVYQNLIYKLYRNTTAANLAAGGINITGNSRNGNIYKNNLRDLKRITTDSQIFAGIVLSSEYTGGTMNINVYNNFILDVQAQGNSGGYSNGYGIVADKGNGYKIYHNTVVLTPASNQSNGGYSAAFYVNENVTGLDVRNNIFVNAQTQTTTRRTAITVKNTAANVNSVFTNLDYNNYYSTDRLGYIAANNGVNNITWPGTTGNENSDYIWTLDGWKTAINSASNGKDAHTKNVNPSFVSATDLHINGNSTQNDGFVDAGTNAIYSFVGKDIDGQVRKPNTPDMGADEFGTVSAVTPGSNDGIYCDSATTFTGYVNGVAQWSNGAPAIDKDVIFNADFTQNGGSFYACSVHVMAGKSVNFQGNSTATVQHVVNIADTGSLTFESGSILIQIANVQNSGLATVRRKGGMLKRLDYTLWSSPVTDNRTTGYQTLLSFSPLTATSPMRFYYYDTTSDSYLAYTSPGTTKFALGKSALIRMPNNMPDVPGYNTGAARWQFEGPFQGTPNNGDIRIPLEYVNRNFNGVGNPYPSPLSIAAFIQENANNNGTIVGTIWLWRKTNDSSQSSYSTCTIDGYVANMAPGGTSADGNSVLADPNGILNTGQGFIVRALQPNKELVFRNNMRVDSHTTTFFKTQNTNEGPEAVQGGKFWINAKGGDNWSQMMLSYNDYTSLGYDNGYDGIALNGGNLSLYTLIPAQAEGDEDVKVAIQSRGNFAQADAVPVGYIAAAAGTYELEIDHAEGIFAEGTDIYVKDNMMGTTQKLNNGSYTFTTAAGTFESRFEIVYAPQGELGTTPVVVDAKDIIVYRDGQQIKVTSPEEISAVTVYDMLGRTLFTQNEIGNTEFSTSQLNIAQQVVIVNVTLSNKQTVSTKIMMN